MTSNPANTSNKTQARQASKQKHETSKPTQHKHDTQAKRTGMTQASQLKHETSEQTQHKHDKQANTTQA
jgi:hypothetical protein